MGRKENSWVLQPIVIAIQRMVPSTSDGEKSVVLNTIYFGKPPKTPAPAASKALKGYKDPYSSASIVGDSPGLDILEVKADVSGYFTYSASSHVCIQPKISLWPYYRVWHLKQLISTYIGCPVSHITLVDGKDRPLWEETEAPARPEVRTQSSTTIEAPAMPGVRTRALPAIESKLDTLRFELLHSVDSLPDVVHIYLAGDWVGNKQYSTSSLISLGSLMGSERYRVMSLYATKEKALSFSKGGEPELTGSVTRTTLTAYPNQGGRHTVDVDRVFQLLHLDPDIGVTEEQWKEKKRVEARAPLLPLEAIPSEGEGETQPQSQSESVIALPALPGPQSQSKTASVSQSQARPAFEPLALPGPQPIPSEESLQGGTKRSDLTTVTDWLTIISRNKGGQVLTKAQASSSYLPSAIIPPSHGTISVLILLREKPTNVHLHAYIITLYPDFHITVSTNWSDDAPREVLRRRSLEAMKAFLKRLYSFFEEDVMRPDSTLPKREKMRDTLSISAYRESFNGGKFDECRELVAQMAKAELAKITYLTASSIYFQLPMGWSEGRDMSVYMFSSDREIQENVSESGTADMLSFVMKGPEIQLKAEGTELFVTITGCDGDEEIATCGKLIGAMVQATGYSPSKARGERVMKDYANLSLLEQIDPVLFGSHPQPGGERVNYSRECQGAARHPVPISIDEALADPSSRTAILTNRTYGGPQAYRAPTSEYPVIAYRPVPFRNYCIVCCVQKEVSPSSLRWEEYSECERRMLFDSGLVGRDGRSASSVNRGKKQQYNPLQFDGTYIVRGRVASFPKGVKESLPISVGMYSPPEVDASDIHAVIEWATSDGIERTRGVGMRGERTDQHTDMLSPYDIVSSYAIRGVPISLLRMYPTSKNTWRASWMDMTEFYDVPPFVICTWTEGPDQIPTTFYPIVNEQLDPMTSDDLGIEMSPFGTRHTSHKHVLTVGNLVSLSRVGSRSQSKTAFEPPALPGPQSRATSALEPPALPGPQSQTTSALEPQRPSGLQGRGEVEVTGVFMEGDVCYAVMISLPKSPPFMLPIVPERTKPFSPVQGSSAKSHLPTIDQLRTLFSIIETAFPFYSPSVKTIVTDEKGRIRAFIIYPDGVVIHMQATAEWEGLFSPSLMVSSKARTIDLRTESGVRATSKTAIDAEITTSIEPEGIHGGSTQRRPIASLSSTVTTLLLPSHLYNLLWDESSLYHSSPLAVDSPLTEQNIRITQLYLAASLVRSGAVGRLPPTRGSKSRSAIEPNTQSGSHSQALPRHPLVYDDLLKWFQIQCKGLVIISPKVRFVLVDDNVVMLSERITVTKELYEAATTRLASSAPKNVELLLPYLRSFGTVLRPDDVSCRPWEKVLA